MPVKHAFTSAKSDGGDSTLVRPSNWNADHTGAFDVFNVKDPAYGALGNGSNDDTAEIQAAIAACNSAGGGTVYFPPGVYVVSGAVALTYPGNQIVLRGAGNGDAAFQYGTATSVIKYNGTGTVIANSDPCTSPTLAGTCRYWCGIERLTIDVSGASSGFTYGLDLANFNHFTARDVTITSCYTYPGYYRAGTGIRLHNTGETYGIGSTYYNTFENVDIHVGASDTDTCVLMTDFCNRNMFLYGNFQGKGKSLNVKGDPGPDANKGGTTDTGIFLGVSFQTDGQTSIDLGRDAAAYAAQCNGFAFIGCMIEGYPGTGAPHVKLRATAHHNYFLGCQGGEWINDTPANGNTVLGPGFDTYAWAWDGDSAGMTGVISGIGTPESYVAAGIGSIYVNLSGGVSTTLYVKTSGTGKTGWTAK
jgi:hypothetical protein